MRVWMALTRRELAGYFCSITGYLVAALAVFLMGLSFIVLLTKLQSDRTPLPITQLFYLTPFFWFIVLLSAPVITMRLFALEKASGTYETLMTAPVKELQVVLAKFTAAMIFFVMLWLPLLALIFTLEPYGAVIDAGSTASTFLGIFLIGLLFVSSGCFASSLTRSQTTAAMLSFAIGLAFFLTGFFTSSLPPASNWKWDVLSYVGLIRHMDDFSRGVIDTRPLVFYPTAAAFFLFLTYRVLESRRWK